MMLGLADAERPNLPRQRCPLRATLPRVVLRSPYLSGAVPRRVGDLRRSRGPALRSRCPCTPDNWPWPRGAPQRARWLADVGTGGTPGRDTAGRRDRRARQRSSLAPAVRRLLLRGRGPFPRPSRHRGRTARALRRRRAGRCPCTYDSQAEYLRPIAALVLEQANPLIPRALQDWHLVRRGRTLPGTRDGREGKQVRRLIGGFHRLPVRTESAPLGVARLRRSPLEGM